MINLKDITLETRTIEVTYPGMPHVKLKLNYMSRAASKRVMSMGNRDEWVNGTMMKVRDEDKFLEAFVDAAISGWTGLTIADVEKLMLIETEADPATEVPFSRDNAIMLMQNSAAFDSWINETVFQLDNFRSPKS
ncbi:hypothetical protein BN79_151 [Yersinia phage phiR2-01]|uniref:Tape measure chaperone n=1 Tax=Yersinia phage phiR2-01 TaxID=1206557 RepID=I7KQY2_9CAUD|nr:hypothetical protein BN79_151 [Yersinia phage phiR2-01]CCI88560.1 hypothetical protein BN79_151 [Yersinia phage phiR2-01]